jgi:hypothetical protein
LCVAEVNEVKRIAYLYDAFTTTHFYGEQFFQSSLTYAGLATTPVFFAAMNKFVSVDKNASKY